MALLAGPAPDVVAASGASECPITNASRSVPRPTFTDLASAIDDAEAGEALRLRGRCEASEVLVNKSLTIQGVRKTSPDSGPATISGALSSGRLLSISGATVAITGVRLTGGDVSGPAGLVLVDGETSPAKVVLKNATVSGNSAQNGGALHAMGTAGVTLSGRPA